jgi:long-chain fatty acid transport protein
MQGGNLKRLALALVIGCFVVFCQNSSGYAAGFLIYSHDAASNGMGLAFAAQADNPSAIFYNPAGINLLEGTNFSSGGSIIMPDTTYKSPSGNKTDMEKHVFFVPSVFLTHKINDKFSAGLGLFSPFGLSNDWPNDWEGRFISTFAEIKSIFLNPTISWQLHPKLSLAAGINYVDSEVKLKRSVDIEGEISKFIGFPVQLPGSPEGRTKIDGEGNGVGYNLGLLFHFTDTTTIGISYRSSVDIDYDGDVDFNIPQPYSFLFPDGDVSSNIELPPILAIGICTTAINNWTFEFDLVWTGWSTFDKLTANFKEGFPPDETISRNWDDVISYHFGIKYHWNESLVLRWGYIFDESPVPEETMDPILPDADSHIVTFGVGYQRKNLSFDLSYMGLIFEDRRTDKNIDKFYGEYETFTNLIAFNFQYRF